MKHIRTKLFFVGLVGTMFGGATVVSAAPTAGLSSYMSYISTAGMNPTAGVSSVLSTTMVSSAKSEMLAGVTINIENLEHVSVASNGESDLEVNSINSSALGAAVNDEYTYIAVAKTDSYFNVRAAATTESDVVGKLRDNNVATVLAVEGNWYKISSGNVIGYVRSDLVTVGDSELVQSVGDFTYAESREEEEARLEKEAERAREEAIKNSQKYESYVEEYYGSSVAGVSGQAIVDYAVQFVGYPYVRGGNSLTQGTDCSGFTKLIYAKFGYNLPRCDSSYYYVGRSVSLSEARAGDILVFDGHVAIYMGDGQIVHAANKRDGIKISGFSAGKVRSVRRIIY